MKKRAASVIGLVAHWMKTAARRLTKTGRAAPEPASKTAVGQPGETPSTITRPEEDGNIRAISDESMGELQGETLPAKTPVAAPAQGKVQEGANRDFENRIDAARNRIGTQDDHEDETQALLERAVGLLETVSAHPAIRDYAATKRKLEEIEQRLGYGSYPQ